MDKILNRAADNIRILSASMVEKPNQGIREVQWVALITLTCCILNS